MAPMIDPARYPRLSRVDAPADLRQFDESELTSIAEELRAYLIESVGRSGGHFGAGLGVIELTVALHYLYDTPHDRLVWDVGHQTYPHKILTGRRDQIHTVKQADGVAPRYPFYDHRVVELCVWQPVLAKVAGGQPRALLREAMRGVLPESVRLRRDKTNFIADFWTTLRQDPQGRLAAFRAGPGSLQGWVDAGVLRADATRLAHSADPDPQVAFRLWRALWLAAWFERGAPLASAAAPPSLASRAPCPILASDP